MDPIIDRDPGDEDDSPYYGDPNTWDHDPPDPHAGEATSAWGHDPPQSELCPVCGQPDNCGDCNHVPNFELMLP